MSESLWGSQSFRLPRLYTENAIIYLMDSNYSSDVETFNRMESAPDRVIAKALVDLTDSIESLTPEITHYLRNISTSLIYMTDANDVSTELDEYIGSLDDFISGRTDDQDSIVGFKESLMGDLNEQ